jgi:hypothetical protein
MISDALTSFVFTSVDLSETEMGHCVLDNGALMPFTTSYREQTSVLDDAVPRPDDVVVSERVKTIDGEALTNFELCEEVYDGDWLSPWARMRSCFSSSSAWLMVP